VLEKFHASDAFVRIVMGPRGSGKSHSCQAELFRQALEMPACEDGVRRSRYVVIRNSYRALETSALATHRVMFAGLEGFSDVEIAVGREPWRSFLRMPLPDGTRLDSEWLWLALDSLTYDKLRSTEYTGAYINEIAHDFADTTIVTKVIESAGRYPPKHMFSDKVQKSADKAGKSIYRAFVIADTNPPNTVHPMVKLFDVPPPDWAMFRQIPAIMEIPEDRYEGDKDAGLVKNGYRYIVNPDSPLPSIHNGGAIYWFRMLADADRSTIDSSILGKPSKNIAGKPVYPMFDEDDSIVRYQLSQADWAYKPLVVGIDTSGLNPAAVVCMYDDATLWVLDEVFEPDTPFNEFVQDMLLPTLQQRYPTNRITCVLDPSNPQSSLDRVTALQVIQRAGLNAVLASTNNPTTRIQAVAHFLGRRGRFKIAGHCAHTLEGLRGGYRYSPIKGQSGVFKTTPDKNASSHTQDSLQYACLLVKGGSDRLAPSKDIQLPRMRII
jgi:hypothetical protein